MCNINRQPNLGFTLVELLAIMLIIGILISLLLPAIQSVREASRETHCSHAIRQIGLATHNFESTYAAFPASGWNRMGLGNPHGKHQSWRPLIFPFIEQSNVSLQYDQYLNWWEGSNSQLATYRVSVFECPSVPYRTEITAAIAKAPRPALSFAQPLASIDYEAILGVQPNSINPHLLAPYYHSDNRFSVMHRNSQNRFADIHDGTSTTIMVVECGGRPLVYRNGMAREDIQNDQGIGWADNEGPFSLDGSNQDGSIEGGGPSFGCIYPMNRKNDNEPFSFHNGGCNFLFADGHVAFLAETVTLTTLARLCTRAGGEVVSGLEF
jgi:prepilin-type processing-associated H-X9-DG protein